MLCHQKYMLLTLVPSCRDFDPFSLRMELPGAVAALAQNAEANGGTAYVHCTGARCAALSCAMLRCMCCDTVAVLAPGSDLWQYVHAHY